MANTTVKDRLISKANTDGTIDIMGIRITNPDKTVYQTTGMTKGDVVKYYASAASYMLPYVKDRLLSSVRCPKGVGQPCFYKKHPNYDGKGISVLPIETKSGENEEYVYIDGTHGIVSEAQFGTIEFHVWASAVKTLEKPDIMVFDLDPDENLGIDKVQNGANDLKEILEQLSLTPFLKASGGKGYHVVVPFLPHADWETFRDFSRSIALVMENKWPDRYTCNMRKEKRQGRIFIDWVRNGRGATSVAPYSLRARATPAVAAPLHWDELTKIKPNGITPQEALSRFSRPDPWADFFKTGIRLKF